MELLFYAVGMALMFAVFYAAIRFDHDRRARDLGRAAEKLGLVYYPNGREEVMPEIAHLALFHIGSSPTLTHLIVAETEEYTIAFFDYSYRTSSKSGGMHTVVAVQSPALNMPQFQIQPKGLLGVFRLQIPELFRRKIRVKSHPEFASLFSLTGANEEDVLAFLDSKLAGLFENFEGYSIEGGDHAVIFYRHNILLRGSELKDHVNRARAVYRSIVDRRWT